MGYNNNYFGYNNKKSSYRVRSKRKIPPGYISVASVARLANIGVNKKYPLDGNYILTADIDLSGYSAGEGWVPIGNSTNKFTGTFDGNNYVITNLTINRNANYQGLFGYANGEIKNLGLENVDIVCRAYAGGLVGYNYGTIQNCYANGILTGLSCSGGLVGESYGIIENCHANVNVDGSTSNCIGGLVGWDHTIIANCYATGTVKGYANIGGLVSMLGTTDIGAITNCYATGNISGTNDHVGGLVGCNYGTIKKCYSAGYVTGRNYIGGLVGLNHESVIRSYYDKTKSGQSDTGQGTPLTTTKMKTKSSFVTWDFVDIWAIDNSYPYLRDNEQVPHPGA